MRKFIGLLLCLLTVLCLTVVSLAVPGVFFEEKPYSVGDRIYVDDSGHCSESVKNRYLLIDTDKIVMHEFVYNGTGALMLDGVDYQIELEGTNSITSSYIDDHQTAFALFSDKTITFTGTGSLTLSATYSGGTGIVGVGLRAADLVVNGPTIEGVTTGNNGLNQGIWAGNSITVTSGTLKGTASAGIKQSIGVAVSSGMDGSTATGSITVKNRATLQGKGNGASDYSYGVFTGTLNLEDRARFEAWCMEPTASDTTHKRCALTGTISSVPYLVGSTSTTTAATDEAYSDANHIKYKHVYIGKPPTPPTPPAPIYIPDIEEEIVSPQTADPGVGLECFLAISSVLGLGILKKNTCE